jgi:hypothetical protein
MPLFLLCVLHRFVGICYVSSITMFTPNHLSRLYLKQHVTNTWRGTNTHKIAVTLGITKYFLSIHWTQFNIVHEEKQSAYGMTHVKTVFIFLGLGGSLTFILIGLLLQYSISIMLMQHLLDLYTYTLSHTHNDLIKIIVLQNIYC